jgi:hypothetical protein
VTPFDTVLFVPEVIFGAVFTVVQLPFGAAAHGVAMHGLHGCVGGRDRPAQQRNRHGRTTNKRGADYLVHVNPHSLGCPAILVTTGTDRW